MDMDLIRRMTDDLSLILIEDDPFIRIIQEGERGEVVTLFDNEEYVLNDCESLGNRIMYTKLIDMFKVNDKAIVKRSLRTGCDYWDEFFGGTQLSKSARELIDSDDNSYGGESE